MTESIRFCFVDIGDRHHNSCNYAYEQVLATGQRIRFTCTILAGFIQACLVNGPSTNPAGCPISFQECWSWGFTGICLPLRNAASLCSFVSASTFVLLAAFIGSIIFITLLCTLLQIGTFMSLQSLRSVVSVFVFCSFRVVSVAEYYGLLFCILFVLFIPIVFLKEMDGSKIPRRTFNEHRLELWETLQNRTTLYLLIFVSGASCFSSMVNEATVYLQYYIIQLTNFQSGIGEKSMSMCIFV